MHVEAIQYDSIGSEALCLWGRNNETKINFKKLAASIQVVFFLLLLFGLRLCQGPG